MSLPAPVLDDRSFQDLVDQAKKRIPHYCESWTDHNVSDPGVTLIELFAYMTDQLLYRINQVPDLHYIRFMEMFGMNMAEPTPARAPITFWLSAALETTVHVPLGTEVSTTQTESEPPIVFTIDETLKIEPPDLGAIMLERPNESALFSSLHLRRVQTAFESFDLFSAEPHNNDAIYFGFNHDPSNTILGFDFKCDPRGGAGIDPMLPPYIWEAATGGGEWEACDLLMDSTRGLNTSGRMYVHMPKTQRDQLNNATHFWLRLRLQPVTEVLQADGMRPYRTSPHITQIEVSSWGGTVQATHAQVVQNEFIGISNGAASQSFRLATAPILPRRLAEHLLIQEDGYGPEAWQEVADFADSGPTDKHYTLDSITGELKLGAAIRQPNGSIQLFGAVPPRGAHLRFVRYRHGGGANGNVQIGRLNLLKSAIPFIARVHNRQPATGGLNQETLEQAMVRAPAELRTRDRAVTEADFEFLAHQALRNEIGRVGRIKCLQPRPSEAGRVAPGQVYVLAVPQPPNPAGPLREDELQLDPDIVRVLRDYLDERRLLTMRLDVRQPAYAWAAVRVQCKPDPSMNPADVEIEIFERLYRFLNPLTGGRNGDGWEFGRNVYLTDIFHCLQGLTNVQFIREVELFNANPSGAMRGKAVDMIEIVGHGCVASGIHVVEFI
ncbi:MAG: putative baseplate assembly protein [Candidatus Promineifilaceae bacterium]